MREGPPRHPDGDAPATEPSAAGRPAPAGPHPDPDPAPRAAPRADPRGSARTGAQAGFRVGLAARLAAGLAAWIAAWIAAGRRRELLRAARPTVMAAVVIALGVGGQSHPRPALHGTGLVVLVALVAVVLGTLLLPIRRPDPPRPDPSRHPEQTRARLAVFAVVIAGSAVLAWIEPAGAGFLGGYVAASTAGSRLPRRAGAVVAGCAVVAFAVAGTAGADRPLTSVVIAETGLVAFYYSGRYAQRLRDRTTQAERLLAELEETRAAQAEAAALAERQRLAREVHDVLAHTLSGLVLHLEGTRLLAARGANPQLAGMVERAHHLAASGLQETRRAIGMLRDEQLPGPELLPTLAGEFERDTGVACHLSVTGTPRDYGPQARLTLYRVAQEALTNARKHAAPVRVELRLRHAPDGARLTVEDIGTPAPPAAADDGYGLTGMRERAALLGGTLTAAPTGTGFLVELWIPA